MYRYGCKGLPPVEALDEAWKDKDTKWYYLQRLHAGHQALKAFVAKHKADVHGATDAQALQVFQQYMESHKDINTYSIYCTQ